MRMTSPVERTGLQSHVADGKRPERPTTPSANLDTYWKFIMLTCPSDETMDALHILWSEENVALDKPGL